MTTPATRASSDLYCAKSCPISVEIVPSVTKTILKPTMKAMEFSITLRRRCPSSDLSSSTPAPETSETYPGTSGSTHGDKNEISPATKAAIGRGKEFIFNPFYRALENGFRRRFASLLQTHGMLRSYTILGL